MDVSPQKQPRKPQKNQKHNSYIFRVDNEKTLRLSSDFDGGNIRLVKQTNELQYLFQSVGDLQGVASKKSWFYFKMQSHRGIKVRLIIQNIGILDNIYQDKSHYKPFQREGDQGLWQEMPQAFLTYRDQVVLVIDHTFKNSNEIYVCLSIPFTYSQQQKYLQELSYKTHQNIFYRQETLARSPQGRSINLLTITQLDHNEPVANIDKKPVVMITSRVHPGQVSSSYCLQGILQFLLRYNNLQAYLLRRLFVFKIVPMINPDGVAQGNYRLDPLGNNLNRVYLEASPTQHPSIFQISELVKNLTARQKIQFYFDLHSHSSIKESFIYGNAVQDIVQQTYSALYCKLLQQNFPRFRYGLSNFDQKHMKHKDKGESLSKEGCARVVLNRLFGVVQSYTVQSSMLPSAYNYFINKAYKNAPKNQEFVFTDSEGQQYFYEPIQEEKCAQTNLMIAENKQLGRGLMVSILDMIKKNPYSRMAEDYNQIFYKDCAAKLLQNEQRFKLLDVKAYQKARVMPQFICLIQNKLEKQWSMSTVSALINGVEWPKTVRKLNQQILAKNVQASLARESKNVHSSSLREQKSIHRTVRIRTQFKEKPSNRLNINIKESDQTTHRIDSLRSSCVHNQKTSLPDIKYSIQVAKKSINQSLKTPIKDQHFQLRAYHPVKNNKTNKKFIFEYAHQQIHNIVPDRLSPKRSNDSLSLILAKKIIQRQKSKIISTAQHMLVESRKRVATQIKKGQFFERNFLQRTSPDNEEETFGGLEVRRMDISKKHGVSNRGTELRKERIKLPEVVMRSNMFGRFQGRNY